MGQKRDKKGRWIPGFVSSSDDEETPPAKRTAASAQTSPPAAGTRASSAMACASSSKARHGGEAGPSSVRRPYTRSMGSGSGAKVDSRSGDDVEVIEPKAAQDTEVVNIISSGDDSSGDDSSDSSGDDSSAKGYVVSEQDINDIWDAITKQANDQGGIKESVLKLKRSLNKYMTVLVVKKGEEMKMLSEALATLKSKVETLEEENKKKNAELAGETKKNRELAESLARLEAKMASLEGAKNCHVPFGEAKKTTL